MFVRKKRGKPLQQELEGKEPLQALIFAEWRQQWRNVWEWEINQWKVHCVMGWGYD